MIRKYWKRILLVLLVGVVLFFTVGLPYAIAYLVTSAGTRPMDLELTSTPADYGADYESVPFESRDGIALSGWYLGDGQPSGVVVACGHGLFRSRREVLDRAVFFRKAGFPTLVFDFRKHGESAGERVSLGYHERQDFEGAVDFLRERNPGARVVLYGVSMGAAAALLAAEETPEVAAVIADSPFSSIEHTVTHHVDLVFGLPRFPFGSALLTALEMRGGFDREDFDLERAVVAIGDRPLLVVAGGEDRRMPAELQRRLAEKSTSTQSMFRSFPGARHGAAYRTDPENYEAMVNEFLSNAGLTRREPKAGAGEGSNRGSR